MKLRHSILAVLALLMVSFATSCSDDDGPKKPVIDPVETGALVVCQGNQSAKIAGELSLYLPADDSIANGVFASVNQAALGYGPQNAARCGDRTFVTLYDDNCLQIMDSRTLASTGRVEVPQPEWVASDGEFVYVAGNDGFLTRLHGLTLSRARLYVGPNPMCVVVDGGYAYVSISDARWGSTYENGRRVVRVDLRTFSLAGEYAVGTNPTTLAPDGQGRLYVACQGNYADIAPEVWQIDLRTGDAHKFADGGSYIAAHAGKLYVITSTYDASWNATYTAAAYNSNGTPLNGFAFSEMPPQPTGISVRPADGSLYVTSDGSASYDAYTLPGRLYIYSPDGQLRAWHTTGVHPVGVMF